MPITVSEVDPTFDPEGPRHFELLVTAFRLMDDGRHDFAVIGAQSAQEIYLELEIARLLEWRRLGSLGTEIAGTLVRQYTLIDGRLRALWYALTGDDFRDKPFRNTLGWWTDYAKHLDLRHRIVHRGATSTRDDAERSLKAVAQALQYIQETTVRVGVDLGRIWDVGTERPPSHDLPAHDRESV
jgi:hypothetical protein